FETSNAGTQVTNTSAGSFARGTAYRVGFIFNPADGTTGSLTPYLNGTAGTAHAITLASLTEMNFVFGVKAGTAAAQAAYHNYAKIVGGLHGGHTMTALGWIGSARCNYSLARQRSR